MAKKTSRKARTQTTKAPVATADAVEREEGINFRGELQQLANIRKAFAPLDAKDSAAFLNAYSAEACRKRAAATKAEDVFRAAMSWTRQLGENAKAPWLSAARARWFLDCATVLGNLLAGKSTNKNPSDEASYDDVVNGTEKLLERTKRRLGNAVGSNVAHRAALKQAALSEGQEGRAVQFRKLAKLIGGWLGKGEVALSVNDINADTVTALEAAAAELEAATARRPAAQQGDRDSPAVNEAEGRLLFAMRPLWNDVGDARDDGHTALVLTTSPAILRGLLLRKNKRKGGEELVDDEPDEGGDQG